MIEQTCIHCGRAFVAVHPTRRPCCLSKKCRAERDQARAQLQSTTPAKPLKRRGASHYVAKGSCEHTHEQFTATATVAAPDGAQMFTPHAQQTCFICGRLHQHQDGWAINEATGIAICWRCRP